MYGTGPRGSQKKLESKEDIHLVYQSTRRNNKLLINGLFYHHEWVNNKYCWNDLLEQQRSVLRIADNFAVKSVLNVFHTNNGGSYLLFYDWKTERVINGLFVLLHCRQFNVPVQSWAHVFIFKLFCASQLDRTKLRDDLWVVYPATLGPNGYARGKYCKLRRRLTVCLIYWKKEFPKIETCCWTGPCIKW